MPRLYKNAEVSVGTIFFKLAHWACVAAFILILSALITYIARIEGRLKRLMLQNLSLLDGMHEGIIVLADEDNSLEFAN